MEEVEEGEMKGAYLPGGDSAVIKKTAGLGLSRPSHSGAVRFQRLERVITAQFLDLGVCACASPSMK